MKYVKFLKTVNEFYAGEVLEFSADEFEAYGKYYVNSKYAIIVNKDGSVPKKRKSTPKEETTEIEEVTEVTENAADTDSGEPDDIESND